MNKEIKVKQIKNYTKHPVNVYVRGKIKTFLPEDKTLRCSYSNELIADMVLPDGDILPLTHINYENPELPPKKDGIFLIVSKIIAELNPDRSDLLLPGGIKYENGNAKGCKSLVRLRKQF